MMTRISLGIAAATMLAGTSLSVAFGQSPADFYKGKKIDMEIGHSWGSGYDVYARLIARFIGKHIPGNPTIVTKNMEGLSSLRLANWLYTEAPQDGSVFGTIGRGLAFDPLLGAKGALFDATKFSWIGSANDEVSVCVAWQGTGITKFEDLMTKQMIVGSTGVGGSDTGVFPQTLNGVLGTKMRLISGYPNGNEVALAMERGEVQGRCSWSWSSLVATHKDWVDQKKVTILAQLSLKKHPDLPDVPLIIDLAKTDEQRQILKLIFARQVIGRPYVAPPNVPKDRVDALRTAFMDTMKDPEFLAEAEKGKLEIMPASGEAVEKLVRDVYQTPQEIAAKAAQALATN